MIDIKELKSRYDEIKKNIADRYMNVDLDAIIAIQDERYTILQEVEVLRAKRNENAAKMKGKIEQSLRAELIEEGKRKSKLLVRSNNCIIYFEILFVIVVNIRIGND